MKRKLINIATILLTLLLSAAADALAAGPARSAGPFVFSRQGAIMLSNGAAPARRLGQGQHPSLSPGGRQAVWVEHGQDAQKARVAVYDLQSNLVTPMVTQPGGYINHPRWSPDGKTIAYVRYGKDGQGELWIVSPGGQPKKLARAGGDAGDAFFEPLWSPDGAHITHHDMRNFYLISPQGVVVRKMALLDIASGVAKFFTSADRFALRPGGSGEIAFSVETPGTKLFQKKVPDQSSSLFLYDPRSGSSTRLTPESLTAFAPVWTPDGRTIFFCGYTDTQAGAAYPFKIYALQPGASPVELEPGEDPMPPAAQ